MTFFSVNTKYFITFSSTLHSFWCKFWRHSYLISLQVRCVSPPLAPFKIFSFSGFRSLTRICLYPRFWHFLSQLVFPELLRSVVWCLSWIFEKFTAIIISNFSSVLLFSFFLLCYSSYASVILFKNFPQFFYFFCFILFLFFSLHFSLKNFCLIYLKHNSSFLDHK